MTKVRSLAQPRRGCAEPQRSQRHGRELRGLGAKPQSLKGVSDRDKGLEVLGRNQRGLEGVADGARP